MVTRWAMSDFGLMTLDTDEEQPFLGYELARRGGYSESSAMRVDEQVQQLLKERYAYTRTCLTERREELDSLVAALMEHETVTHEAIEKLIGPHS
jgi:cell division protease FtsH